MTQNKQSDYDPFTQEIIQGALTGIADEMFVCMARAAMSPVIYEVLDFGVAITDCDGELASAGAGIPGFVNMLQPTVKSVIRKHGRKNVRPGDIFISNDPFAGGVSHLNDVALVMPVFYADRLIAWTANKGHWLDIGGMTPGSLSPLATELFQEGLILPAVRIFARDRPVEQVFDIIRANSRLPEQAMGDLWAGIAALRVGAERLSELCSKYTADLLLEAIRQYLDYGEKIARHGLSRLPKGRFDAKDRLDDGRIIRVSALISDTEFSVDLRNNPPQDKFALNASFHATQVTAQAIFKGLVAPEHWANAGSFRPFRLLTTPGSIFHALPPAAVSLYYENKIRSADLICKALAPYMPERMPAGHFSSVCATLLHSEDVDGVDYTFIEPEVGGWGAGAHKDGEHAQFSMSHGDTFNCPVEINEARNGIDVESLALNDEPCGAGHYRGGKGIDQRYRIRAKKARLTAGYTRAVTPPWGVCGGSDGTVNRLEVIKPDGAKETLGSADNLLLSQNDVVRIVTGNGGGFGDPKQRPRAAVLADLRNGYITQEQALNVYGLAARQL